MLLWGLRLEFLNGDGPYRYKHLLSRPVILRELTAERETLLAQLTALVESMDGEYESKASGSGAGGAGRGGRGRGAGAATVTGRNVSGVVVNLTWCQAVRSKVRRRSAVAALSNMIRFC